jgi:hypothetical protein
MNVLNQAAEAGKVLVRDTYAISLICAMVY